VYIYVFVCTRVRVCVCLSVGLCVCVCVCVCVRVPQLTRVGLSMLAGAGRLPAVHRLDLQQVGSLGLTVEHGPAVDGACLRVDAEVLVVPTPVRQQGIGDLDHTHERDRDRETETETERERERERESCESSPGLMGPAGFLPNVLQQGSYLMSSSMDASARSHTSDTQHDSTVLPQSGLSRIKVDMSLPRG